MALPQGDEPGSGFDGVAAGRIDLGGAAAGEDADVGVAADDGDAADAARRRAEGCRRCSSAGRRLSSSIFWASSRPWKGSTHGADGRMVDDAGWRTCCARCGGPCRRGGPAEPGR